MKILVTGAFGWTARAIIETLNEAGHETIAFDLLAVACPPEVEPMSSLIVSGDIADYKAVNNAAGFADAIIHLAVAVGENDYRAPDVPFATNVLGTYNVFAAARANQVGKVILIGSAAVHLPRVGGSADESKWQSSADTDHLYDLTKRLQETIAQDFCETFEMTATVLRAGHIVDGRAGIDPKGASLNSLDYARGGWVCRHDLATACLKALERSETGFRTFHIIGSNGARNYFDVERAEQELGFKIAERFEQYE